MIHDLCLNPHMMMVLQDEAALWKYDIAADVFEVLAGSGLFELGATDGALTTARFDGMTGASVDASGNIWIAVRHTISSH